MPAIEMVCLANSRKYQERCIAGIRVDGQGWIRPVASTEHGSLFPKHYRLKETGEPHLLDVIRVGCVRPDPKPHQPENWLIDGTPWELVSRPLTADAEPLLQSAVVPGPDLFGSTFDKVPENLSVRTSLALIAPENLRWRIRLTQNFTRQTRAVFSLTGVHYDLSVTDPIWEQRLRHLREGHHSLADAGIGPDARVLFTVSLGEPFNGYCYKLVAAVIVL